MLLSQYYLDTKARWKNISEKEYYRPIPLKNSDATFLKTKTKTLANWIQKYIKRLIHHDQVGFILGIREESNRQKVNQCNKPH